MDNFTELPNVTANPLSSTPPATKTDYSLRQTARNGLCCRSTFLICTVCRWMRLMNPFLSFLYILYNLIANWSISQIWQVVILCIWFYFPTSIVYFHQKFCQCGHDDVDDISCLPTVIFACFGLPYIIFISVITTLELMKEFSLFCFYEIWNCIIPTDPALPSSLQHPVLNSKSKAAGSKSAIDRFYNSKGDCYDLKSPYLQFMYFLLLPLTFSLQTYSNDLMINQEIPIGGAFGTYHDCIAYHASDPFALAVYSWIFVLPINSYNIVRSGMDAQSIRDCIMLSFSTVFFLFGVASLFTKQFIGVMMQQYNPREGTMKEVYKINLK
jgi:hypothetical protein